MRFFTYLLLTSTILLVLSPVSSTATSFFDGTFLNTDWTSTKVAPSDVTPTFSAFQATPGGNPLDFRETDHTLPGPSLDIVVTHSNGTAVYDPSVSGWWIWWSI